MPEADSPNIPLRTSTYTCPLTALLCRLYSLIISSGMPRRLVVLDLMKSVGLNGLLVVLDFVKSVGLVVAEAVCLYVLERAVGLWLVLLLVSLRPCFRIGGGVFRVVGTLNLELLFHDGKTVRLDLVE